MRSSPPALWRPLRHSELTLWRTYCAWTRVRKIEEGAKVVHSAPERTLGLEKENREERYTERQFKTEKSWLREHALDRKLCISMTRPHNNNKKSY